VCGIILFRAVIILFVVVLVVGTRCTSVLSAAPICISPDVGVWALNKWYQSMGSVVR
jgi:hypothetical protein